MIRRIRQLHAMFRRFVRRIRQLRAWCKRVAGVGATFADLVRNARNSRRRWRVAGALASSERAVALAAARRGCPHAPACPTPTSPDRLQAAVVYRDPAAGLTHLCNGIVLNRDPDQPAPKTADSPVREPEPEKVMAR